MNINTIDWSYNNELDKFIAALNGSNTKLTLEQLLQTTADGTSLLTYIAFVHPLFDLVTHIDKSVFSKIVDPVFNLSVGYILTLGFTCATTLHPVATIATDPRLALSVEDRSIKNAFGQTVDDIAASGRSVDTYTMYRTILFPYEVYATPTVISQALLNSEFINLALRHYKLLFLMIDDDPQMSVIDKMFIEVPLLSYSTFFSVDLWLYNNGYILRRMLQRIVTLVPQVQTSVVQYILSNKKLLKYKLRTSMTVEDYLLIHELTGGK